MSTFLIFGNIHLGLELFGAIVFFIITWLFGEAYLLKKDVWSAMRFLGFLLLSLWQLLHAAYGLGGELISFVPYIYLAGLLLILLSYLLEKLPPRPDNMAAALSLPNFFILSRLNEIVSILLLLIAVALTKRFYKDIDKLLKWMLIGFALLATSSFISVFVGDEALGSALFLEHLIKLFAFVSLSFWIWQWLSLRLREEILIVFISASLVIALLITTTFSIFFVQRVELEATNSLVANAKVFNFYLENLKSSALVSSQLMAANSDFVSAIRAGDLADLERISKEFLASTGQQFLSVGRKNGSVLFKLNSPAAASENILSEQIGSDALEGRPAVTIDKGDGEGLVIKAAAPLFDRGTLFGAVIVGIRLDEAFVNNFKEISKLETTILTGNRVVASTLFGSGKLVKELPLDVGAGKEFIGSTRLLDKEIIGVFIPLTNLNNQLVATLAITTTPGQILKDGQSINYFTIFIVLIIVLSLVLPLYRFTVLLTQ